MLTTMLLMWGAPALAQTPPPEDLMEESRRMRRTGAWQLGLGGAGLVGGFALFTVGRPSTQVSTESTFVREFRNVGGIGAMLLGFTGVIVGAHSLDRAGVLRRQATLQVAPEVTMGGGSGVRVSLTF